MEKTVRRRKKTPRIKVEGRSFRGKKTETALLRGGGKTQHIMEL